MDKYEILDIIGNWLLNYAADNAQSVRIDSYGVAVLRGEFDMMELAEALYDEL